MSKQFEGWHFLAADRRVAQYPNAPFSGQIVRAGTKLVLPNPKRVSPCTYGLHASRRAIDALAYAPGPVVQRVRLSGKIIEMPDKAAASVRETLWVMDASLALHIAAVNCAQIALDREEAAGRAVDPRSRAALEVKRRWLNGKATDTELIAAWDAARDAAWDAAGDAARDAAWTAAVAAASAAAWTAAVAAARAAAWGAARDAQNDILEAALWTQYETRHGVCGD